MQRDLQVLTMLLLLVLLAAVSASTVRVRMYCPTWIEWTPGQLAVAAPFEACIGDGTRMLHAVTVQCVAPSNDTRIHAVLSAVHSRFKTLHPCAELDVSVTTTSFALSLHCNTSSETLCLVAKSVGYIQCDIPSIRIV